MATRFVFRLAESHRAKDRTQNNDHGNFTVTLDGLNTTLNAVAGCGGAFGKTCEKTVPGLQFFEAFLNSSEHLITVTNLAGVNQSFFGQFSATVH